MKRSSTSSIEKALASLTHVEAFSLGTILLLIVVLFLGWGRFGEKEITSIPDLDARKSFEILRGDISRIELERPRLLGGHMRIIAISGIETFTIRGRFRDYDGLIGLLNEFCAIPPQIQFSDQT